MIIYPPGGEVAAGSTEKDLAENLGGEEEQENSEDDGNGKQGAVLDWKLNQAKKDRSLFVLAFQLFARN